MRVATRPAPGLELHRDVDEQRRRAADHVGTGTAGRQLRQRRHAGDLADDDRGGLPRIGAGHRSDAGRGAGGPARHRDRVVGTLDALLEHRRTARGEIGERLLDLLLGIGLRFGGGRGQTGGRERPGQRIVGGPAG